MNNSYRKTVENIIAGGIGGFSLVSVGHPLDTVKVRLQTVGSIGSVQYSGLIDCITKTIKNEGFFGLYKGSTSPLIGYLGMKSWQFTNFATCLQLLNQNKTEKPNLGLVFLAGAYAGLAVAFLESPIDLFKVKLQSQTTREFKGVFDCAIKTGRNFGMAGIFQGFTATLIRNLPGKAVLYGSFEISKRTLEKINPSEISGENSKNSNFFNILISGGIAGTCVGFFIYPLDAVKSVIQAEPAEKSKRKYGSYISAVKGMYKSGGFSAFTRGLPAAMIRAFPANAACFYAYETTLKYLQNL